jgi:hypothetical protein
MDNGPWTIDNTHKAKSPTLGARLSSVILDAVALQFKPRIRVQCAAEDDINGFDIILQLFGK